MVKGDAEAGERRQSAAAGSGGLPRIRSAAFFASMKVGALVLQNYANYAIVELRKGAVAFRRWAKGSVSLPRSSVGSETGAPV